MNIEVGVGVGVGVGVRCIFPENGEGIKIGFMRKE